jgi:hypothetical protein
VLAPVALFGTIVVFPPTVPVTVARASPALTHAVTRGKPIEKIFASTPTSLNGGGRSGRLSPMPTSTVTDMFASTSMRGPMAARLPETSVVLFVYGAVGIVELLLFPQFATALVDSLASRRGRFMETKASALSLSLNSKPTGIVGLKARPSRMSTSVMFTLNGSGVSVEPGNPLTALLPMLVSSRRMFELSGIYTC